MATKIGQKEGNSNFRPQETVLFLELVLNTAGCQKHFQYALCFGINVFWYFYLLSVKTSFIYICLCSLSQFLLSKVSKDLVKKS